MDNAKNVLVAAPKDGQAGMGRGQHQADDLFRGQIGIDHFGFAPVAHDFVYRAVGQIKRSKQAVAVFFFHSTFGMAKRDRPCDFLS